MLTDKTPKEALIRALILMAGIREKIEYNDIPKPFKGTAIVLITSCLMAIAFIGFSGII